MEIEHHYSDVIMVSSFDMFMHNISLCVAHHTQFTAPGFYYLKNEYGSGRLDKGGSYVTLVDPNNKKDFSIIIQAMVCMYVCTYVVCIRSLIAVIVLDVKV